MKRRGHRELTGPERSLWNNVARTIDPLPERRAQDFPQAFPQALPRDRALPPLREDDGRHAAPLPLPPKTSPLMGGDPRREKLVARGRLHIDAVLDLHGMRQDEADRATSAFVSRAVRQGHRVLLIITGKGSKDGHDGRGVLRKRFLQAMEGGFYGGRIGSVRPAHQRHGGTGAFYVFLKAQQKA